MYFSYLITTSEESMEKEEECVDDSQKKLFHFPESFWVTQMTPQDNLFSPTANF